MPQRASSTPPQVLTIEMVETASADPRHRAPNAPRSDATGDVRCPTPGCGRKLAEALRGTLTIRCDRCRHTVTIAR